MSPSDDVPVTLLLENPHDFGVQFHPCRLSLCSTRQNLRCVSRSRITTRLYRCGNGTSLLTRRRTHYLIIHHINYCKKGMFTSWSPATVATTRITAPSAGLLERNTKSYGTAEISQEAFHCSPTERRIRSHVPSLLFDSFDFLLWDSTGG
jgi:hypothetical protein